MTKGWEQREVPDTSHGSSLSPQVLQSQLWNCEQATSSQLLSPTRTKLEPHVPLNFLYWLPCADRALTHHFPVSLNPSHIPRLSLPSLSSLIGHPLFCGLRLFGYLPYFLLIGVLGGVSTPHPSGLVSSTPKL